MEPADTQTQVVFILQHVRTDEDGDEEVKILGIYSSRENADRAIARRAVEEGFRDWPGGFCVDAYPLDQDWWVGGFVT